MIFPKAHNHETGQVVVLLVVAEFFKERLDLVSVAYLGARFCSKAVLRSEMTDQAGNATFHAG